MRWNLILDGGQSVVRFVRDWFRSAQTTRSGPVSDQLSDYAPEAAVSEERSMTVAPVWMTGRI
jgi:hypothetical protein